MLNSSTAQIFPFWMVLLDCRYFPPEGRILTFILKVLEKLKVLVLSESLAKEDEMMLASLDDLVAADKTLAEAALDRGVVLKLMFR